MTFMAFAAVAAFAAAPTVQIPAPPAAAQAPIPEGTSGDVRKADPGVPMGKVSKVIFTLEVNPEGTEKLLDRGSIEREIRDWLLAFQIKVVDPKLSHFGLIPHLTVAAFAQRSEDDLYWHAITATCSPGEAPGSSAANSGVQSKPGSHSPAVSHLLAQRGSKSFHDNLLTTIQRSLSDLLGGSLVPVKSKESPWLRGSLDSLRQSSLHSRNVVNYDFAALKIIKQPPPLPYPTEARERNIQGTVVIGLVVDATGVPLVAEALSGPNELLETAMRYALSWGFEPALLNGEPRGSSFKLTMPFRMK